MRLALVGRSLRYLVRLRNSRGFKPRDCKKVAETARGAVDGRSVRVENFRVSNFAVEFDLFADEQSEVEYALKHIPREVGGELTVKLLDGPAPQSSDIASSIPEAKELFNQERFWEFHELLEQFWKRGTGREKELLQGLILVAAAFVHFQKNEDDVCLTMLRKAKEKIEGDSYHGISIRHVISKVKRILDSGEIQVFRI